MYLARYLYSFRARQLLISNGQPNARRCVALGIAATLVRPEEKVLSISGDGGSFSQPTSWRPQFD